MTPNFPFTGIELQDAIERLSSAKRSSSEAFSCLVHAEIKALIAFILFPPHGVLTLPMGMAEMTDENRRLRLRILVEDAILKASETIDPNYSDDPVAFQLKWGHIFAKGAA